MCVRESFICVYNYLNEEKYNIISNNNNNQTLHSCSWAIIKKSQLRRYICIIINKFSYKYSLT